MHTSRPTPGTPMIFQWRKWDGSPHWRHECVYLGSDKWGDWVGQPTGWGSARPGRAYAVGGASVTLVPAAGPGSAFEGAGIPHPDFALTVNRNHRKGMRIYIDLGWEVEWTDTPELVTGIDMDLDVVRVEGERGTWVDDRDEWAEHSALFGYPRDVMDRLEHLALDLEARVRAQVAPFDDATADAWLDRLEGYGLER
ncbi:hypothetical protein [Leucobacter aridicollis]|uniref:hypothetical protein n=1 Tax=Leucobacter aridicollis TaxID=283878 RepID=UPI0021672B04|nr:hypothetical protein [Leucobacter aridicollis]MCS3429007.1 hypothetical protein [Leucobacter aridicollis]